MKELEKFQTVKEVLEDMAKSTRDNYKVTLRQYLEFVNGLTPDELIEEAKTDVKKTQGRISNFYKWLQGQEIEGRKRGKSMLQNSAHQRAYGYLRGWYVNNDIIFERKWTRKIPKFSRLREAIRKDAVYTFFKVDEKKRKIYFDREPMQQFLSNLKLRDQAITLALLSSGQDSGELLRLNIGDIREQQNNRIFWENKRRKTQILFRTFISKEATKLMHTYIKQERANAQDSEPLFVTSGNHGKLKRVTPTLLSSVYRDAAKRMNIKWENGEQNPLRPKRMRHLFRTACDAAGVPELYQNAFMGHVNSQGQDYSELSPAKLELEYLRVEPFLTVYGTVEENVEFKQQISKLEGTINLLSKRNVEFEEERKNLEKKVGLLTEQVEMLTTVLKQLVKATRPNDEEFNALLKQWSKEEAKEKLDELTGEAKPRPKTSLRLPDKG